MFYWLMKTVVLGPILRLIFRPWVTGVDNVPTEGGAILASNHLSFSDSIFLPLLLDRKVTFLAKADYFTGRGPKGRATALFFKLADQLPVDRSGGRASEAALRTGLRVLGRGDLLGIYPEGTRSPDGRLYRGKTGVARMALEARVPVLPVVMVGTDEAQPIGRRLPKVIRIGVKIGAPLDFSRYEGMEGDRFVLRSITDEIMYEIMQLSGQEYVDVYAASMKERLAAAKRGRTVSLPGDPEDESDDAQDADDAAVVAALDPSSEAGGPTPAAADDESAAGLVDDSLSSTQDDHEADGPGSSARAAG